MLTISLRWVRLVRFSPALGALLLFVSISCEKLEGALCPGGAVLCGAGYKCVDKTSGEGYECALSACGDGHRDDASGEQCDEGDNVNGDGCSATCKLEACGNKVRDPGEPCDPSAGDKACNKNCTLGSCGDGRLDALEACDPGQNDQLPESRGCKKDCTGTVLCGNGQLDDGEECDSSLEDAGQVNCGPTCLLPACGNGVRDTGEACDDGNREEDYTCSADCSSDNTCGNGLIDNRFGPGDSRNEKCDDGQRTDSKGCKDACKTATGCKNGKKDTWEECDPTAPGTELGQCDDDCSRPLCGDGTVNTNAGEACEPQQEGETGEQAPIDQAGNTFKCNSVSAGEAAACQTPDCGDSWTNKAAGEQCDNGKQGDTAECNRASAKALYGNLTVECRAPECGDGYVNQAAGEECDYGPTPEGRKDWPAPEGNEQPGVGCNGPGAGELACKLQRCGDGYVHDDECGEADAFDKQTGLGCNGSSAPTAVQCRPSVCGDGYTNPAAGEVCDPEGAVDTPACNGPNAGPRACLPARCGDGYPNQEAREGCDPGDPTPGDELTPADEMTDAWSSCNGQAAGALACSKRSCGDGFPHPREACDSGNSDTALCNSTTSNDGNPNPDTVACTEIRCGDGYVNFAAGEECDFGEERLTEGPGGQKDWVGETDRPEDFCNGPKARNAEGVSVACQTMRCGDGYTHLSECSEEETTSCNGAGAPTSVACEATRCGDGYINTVANEECDPGKSDSSICNGPNADDEFQCKLSECGDGYLNTEAGEYCDQVTDSDTCNRSGANQAPCKKPICGDGYPNTSSPSGTDATGRGKNEECDNGPIDTATCNGTEGHSNCQRSTCNDGHLNVVAGEECDPSVDPSLWPRITVDRDPTVGDPTEEDNLNWKAPLNSCNPSGVRACLRARCGDGYVNKATLVGQTTPFEECDPGADRETWFGYTQGGSDTFPTVCNSDAAGDKKCQTSECGDGVISAGEECDPNHSEYGPMDPTSKDSATCNGPNANDGKSCTKSECGDGYVNQVSEDCDPNDGSGLACTPGCKRSTCGDGVVDTANGEECDFVRKRGEPVWVWCNPPTPVVDNLPGASGIPLGDETPGSLQLGVACKYTGCGDAWCNHHTEFCPLDGGPGQEFDFQTACVEDCCLSP